ncbi:jacalin-like lectin [Paludibacterium purpuratum]|uniref:Jacalin-like lectin domain-containing protein n=1 Tax=Paludibacterium purpuratum TaxID=1144873 RepID=A0A4R7B9N5_9NEIS|nr:glycosyl hydrolase family 18 protein [Paludibacterium purpuratum]TDR81548.1 jacalin-like lectin domain-containing protein [Paludibacterium purpuratum]
MSTPNTPAKSVNAWIYLDEDEPAQTGYNSPDSCYQTLIRYDVYRATDMLNICFFNTVTLADGSYSIVIGNIDKQHPGGGTNADYLKWVVRDARKTNPEIKILATLGYGANELNGIFSGPQSSWPASTAAFGKNLLTYLQQHDLDGFDVDWEAELDSSLTRQQFGMLFTAIRHAFDTAKDRYYYLTLSPANFAPNLQYIDAEAVNGSCDFVNLQLYSGFINKREYLKIGINDKLLAYGAKFESIDGSDLAPYQCAQQAHDGMLSGGYNIVTQWRLNSGDYQFEQAQQMLLHQLVYAESIPSFDDAPIVGAAGNPPITQLTIRSGDVLDAIQATNTGSFSGISLPYQLPQHGGDGGRQSEIELASDDALVEVSGYTGTWYGWNVVVQLTVKTRKGLTFGPYGSMHGVTAKTAFAFTAPTGQSIVAFRGTSDVVPQANGKPSSVIASLNVTCA